MPYSDGLTHARRVDFSARLFPDTTSKTLYRPGDIDNFSLLTGYRYSGQVLQLQIFSNRFLRLRFWIQTTLGERLYFGPEQPVNRDQFLLKEHIAAGLFLGGGASLGVDIPAGQILVEDQISILGFAEERGNTRPLRTVEGGIAWGDIGGDLGNQGDIADALTAQAENFASELAAIDIAQEAQDNLIADLQQAQTTQETQFSGDIETLQGDVIQLQTSVGNIQSQPGGVSEFHYYGPTLPSAPTEGETWRETTEAGLWVGDWEWVSSLSKWIDRYPVYSDMAQNIWAASGIASLTNYAWLRPSPNAAVRGVFQFLSPDDSNRYHVINVQWARLTGGSSSYEGSAVNVNTKDIARPLGSNEAAIYETEWRSLAYPWHVRFQITGVGSPLPAIYGRLLAEQRNIRG